MAADSLRVLLVDDDGGYAALVRAELQPAGIELHTADTLAAATAELARHEFGAILLDLGLPDSSGVATLDRIHAVARYIPIIVLTCTDDDDLAALSIQRGAQDYLVKGAADGAALLRALRHARERAIFRRSLLDGEARFRALVEHSHDAVT